MSHVRLRRLRYMFGGKHVRLRYIRSLFLFFLLSLFLVSINRWIDGSYWVSFMTPLAWSLRVPLVMVCLLDLPVFAAVRIDGGCWSLIGLSRGEMCGGVRCVGVLDPKTHRTFRFVAAFKR
jgi:hypothetical protein